MLASCHLPCLLFTKCTLHTSCDTILKSLHVVVPLTGTLTALHLNNAASADRDTIRSNIIKNPNMTALSMDGNRTAGAVFEGIKVICSPIRYIRLGYYGKLAVAMMSPVCVCVRARVCVCVYPGRVCIRVFTSLDVPKWLLAALRVLDMKDHYCDEGDPEEGMAVLGNGCPMLEELSVSYFLYFL